MSSDRSLKARIGEAKGPCSYHKSALTLVAKQAKEILLPMDRILSEGPGKQHPIVILESCGHMSMTKACPCDAVGSIVEISEDDDELGPDGIGLDLDVQRGYTMDQR